MVRSFMMALLVAGACSKGSDGPDPEPEDDVPARTSAKLAEVEPNDTRDQAQAAGELPVEITGKLSAGDRDIYAIETRESGGYLLRAHIDRTGVRLRAEKHGGKGIGSALSPERIAAAGVVKGTSYIVVEADEGNETAIGDYTLEVARSPWARGAEWEPNDTTRQASEMRVEKSPREIADGKGESIATPLRTHHAVGWWPRRGDVDCFEVPLGRLPANTVARFELTPPEGVRARLMVFDEASPVANAEAAEPGKPAVVPALRARASKGSYVVCARAAEGQGHEARYSLAVRMLLPHDLFELEPNDRRERATTLQRAKKTRGYLPGGDVDWYQISGFHEPLIEIRITPPEGLSLRASLVDPKGKEIARADAAPGKPAEIRGATPAFLKLEPVGRGNTEETYIILAEVESAPEKNPQ